MQNAVCAALLASVICGIIGVIIVEKKLVMMSGGIAHTSYGGVGLGYLLNFQPVFGAFAFAALAAFGIGYLKKKGGAKTDAVIGLFWSLGMALGVLFVYLTPGYAPDLSSYLFGNILSVLNFDLIVLLITSLIVSAVTFIFFNDWKSYLFDSEFAFITGKKTAFLEYMLFVMIALSVVALIKVVGIILVIALLTAPAACSAFFTNSLKKRMLFSVLLSVIFCFAGLLLSCILDIASGASIVIFSVICYAVLYLIKGLKKYERKI